MGGQSPRCVHSLHTAIIRMRVLMVWEALVLMCSNTTRDLSCWSERSDPLETGGIGGTGTARRSQRCQVQVALVHAPPPSADTTSPRSSARITPLHSLDNVVVLAQLLEERDLADRRAGHALVLSLETDLLERDVCACPNVARLVHDTIGACCRRGEGVCRGVWKGAGGIVKGRCLTVQEEKRVSTYYAATQRYSPSPTFSSLV